MIKRLLIFKMAVKSQHVLGTVFFAILVSFYVIYMTGFFEVDQLISQTFTTPKNKQIVEYSSGAMTSTSLGRFGNNLLEYATLYALAKINKCNAYLSPEMANYLLSCFYVSIPINESLDQLAPWKTVYLDHLMKDEYRNLSCENGQFTKFSGYPSDWRYFEDYDDEIRREFSFSASTKSSVDKFLRKVPSSKTSYTYIGVHVRRTDYLIYLSGQNCHLADEKYLKLAMELMNKRHKNVMFVVASDEVGWCRNVMSKWPFQTLFVPQNFSPCLTMAVLSSCNHSIITQGTYGFWGAYLAGGETVYYTDYCHNFSDVLRKFQGLHLNEWIGISGKSGKFKMFNSSELDSSFVKH